MEDFMKAWMATIVVFLLIFLLILAVLYILGSIGLMKITEKLNKKGGWMAWVPFLDVSLMAKIGLGSLLLEIIMPILMILSGKINISVNDKTTYSGGILPSPYGAIALGIFTVLEFVCIHKIYAKMSKKAVLMTVFTVLTLGLMAPIFFFAIRNNKPIGVVMSDVKPELSKEVNTTSLMNDSYVRPSNNEQIQATQQVQDNQIQTMKQ